MTHTISSSHHTRTLQSRTTLPLAAFFAVFFFGILFANLKWSNEVFWLGFQTENSLRQFEAGTLSVSAFLIFFLKNRLVWWALPAVASRLRRRSHLFLSLFSAWLGFAFGFFVTTMIRQFGILSFPVLFAVLFPQILFYAPAYLILLKNSEPCARFPIDAGKNSLPPIPHGNAKRHSFRSAFPEMFLSFAIYTTGALCEYAVNPWLLAFVSRFFLSRS